MRMARANRQWRLGFVFLLPFLSSIASGQQSRIGRLGFSAAVQDSVAPRRPSAGLVTAASALVPGAGQAMLRQRRALAYFVLEAAGVAYYVKELRDGRSERNRYREIALTVSRAPFQPNGEIGSWDYYERMEKFIASGAFDVVPGGATDPESDTETFNGSIWLLARETYWRDPDMPPPPGSPEHVAALRFYEERAVTPGFRWSWLGQPAAYQDYRSAIAGSNSAFRSAEQTLSFIPANHFLSAVDAYVSVHMRLRRVPDGSAQLVGTLPARFR